MTYKDIVNDGEKEAYENGWNDFKKEVEAIIDGCDLEPCCHGINIKELKQKIQELKEKT